MYAAKVKEAAFAYSHIPTKNIQHIHTSSKLNPLINLEPTHNLSPSFHLAYNAYLLPAVHATNNPTSLTIAPGTPIFCTAIGKFPAASLAVAIVQQTLLLPLSLPRLASICASTSASSRQTRSTLTYRPSVTLARFCAVSPSARWRPLA